MSRRIDTHIARLAARGYDWPIPWEIVEDMGRREDCRLVAYLCPAGVPTIAWGETSGVKLGDRCTEDDADRRYYAQVSKYAARVQALCEAEPNEHQLGAMTSLAYNIGLAAFARSTVLRQHNAGNTEAAARAFGLWNKARDPATGQLVTLRGLTARRAAESAIYLRAIDGAPGDRMPQAVAPESSLAASPIAQGGAATAGSGVLATLMAYSEQAKGVADKAAEFVGLPVPALLAAVLVVAGLAVLKWRAKQRAEGWA